MIDRVIIKTLKLIILKIYKKDFKDLYNKL